MKRLFLTAILFLVFAAGTVLAQAPSTPTGGSRSTKTEKIKKSRLGGGLSTPQGILGDAWKTGFHATVASEIKTSSPKMSVVPLLEYHRFALDVPSGYGTEADISGGAVSALLVGADLKYNLGLPRAPQNPYFIAGLGIGMAMFEEFTAVAYDPYYGDYVITVPSTTETKLYFEFGGGIDLGQIFFQVKYVTISTEGESLSFIPLTFGFVF